MEGVCRNVGFFFLESGILLFFIISFLSGNGNNINVDDADVDVWS